MIKSNDKKHDDFKRLAQYRTNEVIRKLKTLSNCANRSAYDYTQEEVEKMFQVIDHNVKRARAQFHFPHSDRFSF